MYLHEPRALGCAPPANVTSDCGVSNEEVRMYRSPELISNVYLLFMKWHWNGTRFDCCHFRDQKRLDFQGPPMPVALVMDLPSSKLLSPSAIQKQVYWKFFVHGFRWMPFQGPKKSLFPGPILFNGPCNRFAPIKGGREQYKVYFFLPNAHPPPLAVQSDLYRTI